MADKEIRGAVLHKGVTYTAGMEDQFEAVIEGDEEVDLDHLTARGAISGFAGEAPEAKAAIDPDAEEKAAILGGGERKRSAPKRATKAGSKKTKK
ncbi:MAG: hypothetical protein LC798_13490 [Chloroflexi bacterium]|nr:hypothetical protein [Chloroflexota bacterium]